MQVEVIKEEGYEEALYGLSLSFKDRSVSFQDWWTEERFSKMEKVAKALAHKDGGHNKFLRQIQLWVDIEAPRCWWSEFDTYKVGTVAQSESTMHTLSKREPAVGDFEEGTHPDTILAFKTAWKASQGDITALKMNLPEGFLQRRLVTMNYQTLREIVRQREGHRLKQWQIFIDEMLAQVQYRGYIVTEC